MVGGGGEWVSPGARLRHAGGEPAGCGCDPGVNSRAASCARSAGTCHNIWVPGPRWERDGGKQHPGSTHCLCARRHPPGTRGVPCTVGTQRPCPRAQVAVGLRSCRWAKHLAPGYFRKKAGRRRPTEERQLGHSPKGSRASALPRERHGIRKTPASVPRSPARDNREDPDFSSRDAVAAPVTRPSLGTMHWPPARTHCPQRCRLLLPSPSRAAAVVSRWLVLTTRLPEAGGAAVAQAAPGQAQAGRPGDAAASHRQPQSTGSRG